MERSGTHREQSHSGLMVGFALIHPPYAGHSMLLIVNRKTPLIGGAYLFIYLFLDQARWRRAMSRPPRVSRAREPGSGTAVRLKS